MRRSHLPQGTQQGNGGVGTGTRSVRDTDKTDKDAHITCQAAAVSGVTPHPTAPRAAGTLEARIRTLRADVSAVRERPRCVPPARRRASQTQPHSATRRRPRHPLPDACPPAGIWDAQPRPVGAPRTGGSHTPQCTALLLWGPRKGGRGCLSGSHWRNRGR